MISSSGECSGDSRPRMVTAAFAAAAGMILCLAAAGCAPESTEQGAPGAPTQDPPSSAATPSAPVDGEPTGDHGTAPVATEDADAPGDQVAPDGDVDSSGEGEGASESAKATDDWREPEDPTAEGPTAAPALPEVEGLIGEDVALPTEVVVSISSITTTTLTAETPGEYTGPAVIVDVQIANESDAPQAVGSAVVALTADDGEVGVPTWASPNDPLQGEVPAGATAGGTYVFMMDPARERHVTVHVNYAAGVPVATFAGTTP